MGGARKRGFKKRKKVSLFRSFSNGTLALTVERDGKYWEDDEEYEQMISHRVLIRSMARRSGSNEVMLSRARDPVQHWITPGIRRLILYLAPRPVTPGGECAIQPPGRLLNPLFSHSPFTQHAPVFADRYGDSIPLRPVATFDAVHGRKRGGEGDLGLSWLIVARVGRFFI